MIFYIIFFNSVKSFNSLNSEIQLLVFLSNTKIVVVCRGRGKFILRRNYELNLIIIFCKQNIIEKVLLSETGVYIFVNIFSPRRSSVCLCYVELKIYMGFFAELGKMNKCYKGEKFYQGWKTKRFDVQFYFRLSIQKSPPPPELYTSWRDSNYLFIPFILL